MTLRTALFEGGYDELGAWTGESRSELVAQEERLEGLRVLWLAWEGGRVVGVLRHWTRPDGRRTLHFGRCVPAAYSALLARIAGECYTTVDAEEADRLAALIELGFQAFAALHARGSSVVTAEVDADNTASNTLMRGLGGHVTGAEHELHRPSPTSQGA